MKNCLPTIFLGLLFGATLFGVKYFYQNHYMPDMGPSLYSDIGGPFQLTHVSGPYSDAKLRGKPSVLYFGFASCPDVCPLSLNKLIKVLDKEDPKLQAQINKVFISVDYKRDTVAIVDEYAKYFAPDFIGLSGTKEQIESVTKSYAVHFEFVPLKDSAMGYTVDHTSRFYLLDENAKLYGSYSDIVNDHKFINDLKKLVKK